MKRIIGGILATALPAPGTAVRTVQVEDDSAGQRLDNFLLRQLKGVPKTHVYRIIRSGEVRINKGRAQADTRLALGDLVRLPPVRISDKVEQNAQAMAEHAVKVPTREFTVLLEDDWLLVIDKPAGVAVHGGSGVSFGVIEQLRMARPQAKFLELVHRLDRETSGILLIAKKRSALTNLQDQFRERGTGKTYLALVAGTWPANRKVLDKPLFKFLRPDGERRVKVVAKDDPQGQAALSLVKVRSRGGEAYSMLEVTIKTGRTHQIRVHLASEGHPIVGDDKYGDFGLNRSLLRGTPETSLKRMFLHAWRLQFTHPHSAERIELLASLPQELEDFANNVANSTK